MGMEVAAGTCFPLSQPLHHQHNHPFSSLFAFTTSSTSSKNRKGWDHHHQTDHRSPFLGTPLSKTRSLDIPREGGWRQVLRRTTTITFHSFPGGGGGGDDGEEDQGFIQQELAITLRRDSNNSNTAGFQTYWTNRGGQAAAVVDSTNLSSSSSAPLSKHPSSSSPYSWPDHVGAGLEHVASSVDLPVSLRMIKKKKEKKRWEEGCLRDAASCSVERAFSSLMFIIRELQSYALQMREILFLQDLQGILARVQGEMHASFVWLFQTIFSCTPTLMLSLMLLLANFSVHSIGHHAAAPPPPASVVAVEENLQQQRFTSSALKTSSAGGRTASVGGGGGGKARPVVGGTDDDQPGRRASSSYLSHTEIPAATTTSTEEGAGTVATAEEEDALWGGIVEEARRMQAAAGKAEVLMDPKILQRLVSPVTVEMEAEDESAYLQTELMYRKALSEDPDNTLLLTNLAQFLYLVHHDNDRAEYYFKRAVGGAAGEDAEALSQYASFLWFARKDLGAAEETFLEAIAADPGNTYHAANYAHFLWNTGGEDTCYPIHDDDDA